MMFVSLTMFVTVMKLIITLLNLISHIISYSHIQYLILENPFVKADGGPASQTMVIYYATIGLIYRVCWVKTKCMDAALEQTNERTSKRIIGEKSKHE